MGQFYSTSHDGSNESEQREKSDYYELLGVQWDSSGEEYVHILMLNKPVPNPCRIKKAYRRKAFELHPDRNYENVETATELFAEIQSAYEVLSDPQERAWYNSHREVFLGGKAETGSDHFYNTRMTTSDDILRLIPKFSPRMEFSDSQSGFYGGLREIFSRLAWEERMACQCENIEYVDYPTFGCRDDSFEGTVRLFYSAWDSFSTKKSFAWKDIYRYSEAPDRRVRRIMEKENKRSRDEGIREFNGAVRSLVSLVKKRDPRCRYNTQSEAQRQEALRQSASAQATRSRAANQANLRQYNIPDWAKSEEPLEYFEDSPGSEVECFDCVVCEKSFKSQQQLQVHMKSKKHLKAIKQLRLEMTTEDNLWDLQASGNDDNIPSVSEHGVGKLKTVTSLDFFESNISEPGDEQLSEDYGIESNGQHVTDDGIFTVGSAGHLANSASGNGTDNRSKKDAETLPSRMNITALEESESQEAIDLVSQQLSTSELNKEPTKKMGKAKQKRAQKAAKKPPELTCASCHLSFASRSQLFTHIQKLGHAQPLPIFSRKKAG